MALRWFALALILFALPAGAQIRKGAVHKNKAARQAARARMVERFNNMTPEERERVTKTLPEDRRKEIEKNRERYAKLSDEQKKKLEKQYSNFAEMPPQQQQETRAAFRQMVQMPIDRRQAMQKELRKLRLMDPSARKQRMDSEAYKGAFSADEQKVLDRLSVLVPQQ
ncbi:MAG: DUF3106 domain-containing protein [Bryobacterales bacterium]|nr:DUF3106 domain-containing protein [Bryobacterales bacterium]